MRARLVMVLLIVFIFKLEIRARYILGLSQGLGCTTGYRLGLYCDIYCDKFTSDRFAWQFTNCLLDSVNQKCDLIHSTPNILSFSNF